MRVLLTSIATAIAMVFAVLPTQGQDQYEPVAGGIVPQQPYQRFTTYDGHGRTVTFYISEEPASSGPLPLVVYVHGSGARSHFVNDGGRTRGQNGHSTLADVVRGRARLVIVEKPGVNYGDASSGTGGAEDASIEFRFEHTLERWTEAVYAAVHAALRVHGVNPERVLAIGHSEGGIVAAKLSADHDVITHVAVLAGGGPSQLYSLLTLARSGVFFDRISPDAGERVDYVLERWAQIQADPDNAERLFFGHPFRRWSSFLKTSTVEHLLRTDAQIFVAQGTADRAVAPETFDVLRAELQARGRNGEFRRIEGADHNFVIDRDGQRIDSWADILTQVMSWFNLGGVNDLLWSASYEGAVPFDHNLKCCCL